MTRICSHSLISGCAPVPFSPDFRSFPVRKSILSPGVIFGAQDNSTAVVSVQISPAGNNALKIIGCAITL